MAASVLAMLVLAAACSGSPNGGNGSNGSNTNPSGNILFTPSQVFATLAAAGLPCANQPTRLAAGGAHVAVCQVIAGVPKSFLTVGQYPTTGAASRAFRANCTTYRRWNLFREGQNWRGALGVNGGVFPKATALRIASALHTDLHYLCGPA